MYAVLLITFLACEVTYCLLTGGSYLIGCVRKHTEVVT